MLIGTAFPDPAGGATLQLHLHNDAGLNPASIEQSLRELERILSPSGSGMKLHVFGAPAESSCEPAAGYEKIADLRILGRNANSRNHGRPALGYSTVGSEGGVYAVLFLRAIQRQASAANIPWTVLLAYAAAHEIGHLLLGSQAHTERGVMKASWDRDDMQAMCQLWLRFSGKEQRSMAEACDRRSRGHSRPEGFLETF